MDFRDTLAGTARELLAAGGALQSSGGTQQIDPLQVKDAVVEHLRQLQPADPLALASAASQIIQSAGSALAKASAGSAADLDDAEFDCLEVIVQVLGRPALRLPRGRVNPPAVDIGKNERWILFVSSARDKINGAAASVARLNLLRSDGREEHLGTAWRLGKDLVVTNRHVVETLILDRTLAPPQWALDPGRPCVADFSSTDEPVKPVRFMVDRLAYCAPEAGIDAAVLRLRPDGAAFPAALGLSFDELKIGRVDTTDAASFLGEELYVLGHPLQRLPTPQTLQVFGDADGRKRCAPGRATALRRSAMVFEHDCSTLRGNSGSAVLDLYEHRVIGIHLGGRGTDPAGTIGPSNDALSVALLGGHPLGKFLLEGEVPGP